MLTKTEAYNHLIAMFDAGRLGARDSEGACIYTDGYNCCGIGALLPEEIRQRVGDFEGDVHLLMDHFDEVDDWVKRASPFSDAQLLVIQRWHDWAFTDAAAATEDFRDLLVALRDGEVTTLAVSPDLPRCHTISFL